MKAIELDWSDTGVFMIDEIGKMECPSETYQLEAKKLLTSDRALIASIAQSSGRLIAEAKR